MLNYYEETMPLETDEDEYKKYLIDDDLPLFDKLNIIIKKGDSIQKQALLNSLNIYINDCLFKSLIEYIISEIVTWDLEIRLIFPRCLNNILLNYLSSINNEIFNIIFKHIILSISSGNEKISKEYIFYFDIIIEEFTRQKIFVYAVIYLLACVDLWDMWTKMKMCKKCLKGFAYFLTTWKKIQKDK